MRLAVDWAAVGVLVWGSRRRVRMNRRVMRKDVGFGLNIFSLFLFF